MDDGQSPSAWSRGVSEPEKPTPGASARAEVPRACGGIRSDFRAERAKGTGFSIEDGAHRVASQASQSVAQYLSPFSHNGWPLSARMHLRTLLAFELGIRKRKARLVCFTVSFTLFPWVRFVLSAALLNYICSDEVGSAEVVQERSGRLGVWSQHSGSGVVRFQSSKSSGSRLVPFFWMGSPEVGSEGQVAMW